jgi:putative salt-induced outer membrane protein YdiY
MSLGIAAGVLALVGGFPSAALADQIVMKNGDRVTGSIVKQDGKQITIKTDNFGVVIAPWDAVVSVNSDQPLNVGLKDGKTVVGKISGTEGKVQVATEGTTVDVPSGEVASIRNADEQQAYERLLSPGLTELWAGTASIGWAGTNGNAKTLTFTMDMQAARTTTTDKTSIYFKLIKASALVNGVSADTAQAVRGGLAYNHNVSPKLFVNVFNDYEYDRFQNLDLRFVLGGGFGYHAIKQERTTLDLVGGFDYNHSRFSTPETVSTGELFWGDDFTHKLRGSSSFIQTFRMFHDLSSPSDFRMNADIGISTKVNRWLTWTVALSDRYLSTPAVGRKTNDWLYTTGLGITFSQ